MTRVHQADVEWVAMRLAIAGAAHPRNRRLRQDCRRGPLPPRQSQSVAEA